MIWDRAQLLQAAGLDLIHDVRLALTRTRRALHSRKDAHALKAASMIFDLAGVRRIREDDASDAQRPVSVTLVLAQHQQRLLEPGVLQIRLDDPQPVVPRALPSESVREKCAE